MNSNAVRAVRRRGNVNNGANYGPRYVNANNAPSNGNWNYGAALYPCQSQPQRFVSYTGAFFFRGLERDQNTIRLDRPGRQHKIESPTLPAPGMEAEGMKSMKRAGNLWGTFCCIETATEAIYRGTENKRTDRVVVRIFGYGGRPEQSGTLNPAKVRDYAERLVAELNEGRWQHKPGKKRHIVSSGKEREIEIARLRDHIVQWMAMITTEKLITGRMYRYSVGNMPNRGIEDARRNVERWVRSGDCKYFVKLDIRHFYQTVKLDILRDMMHGIIKDRRFLNVMDQIIYSAASPAPETGALQGLAIGYYSSPWLANFYLEPLDRFITSELYKVRRGKRIKAVKHYLRYVDDLLLMGNSESDLKKAVRKIKTFLKDRLDLEIKDSWEICKIGETLPPDDGGKQKLKPGTKKVDIVGYTFTRTVTAVRARNFLRLRRLTKKISRKIRTEGRVTLRSAQAFVSRCGWFTHADSRFFFDTYVSPYIHIDFMKEVLSYAGKNGIVGASASIYCRAGKGPGDYHVLYGREGRTA